MSTVAATVALIRTMSWYCSWLCSSPRQLTYKTATWSHSCMKLSDVFASSTTMSTCFILQLCRSELSLLYYIIWCNYKRSSALYWANSMVSEGSWKSQNFVSLLRHGKSSKRIWGSWRYLNHFGVWSDSATFKNPGFFFLNGIECVLLMRCASYFEVLSR